MVISGFLIALMSPLSYWFPWCMPFSEEQVNHCCYMPFHFWQDWPLHTPLYPYSWTHCRCGYYWSSLRLGYFDGFRCWYSDRLDSRALVRKAYFKKDFYCCPWGNWRAKPSWTTTHSTNLIDYRITDSVDLLNTIIAAGTFGITNPMVLNIIALIGSSVFRFDHCQPTSMVLFWTTKRIYQRSTP